MPEFKGLPYGRGADPIGQRNAWLDERKRAKDSEQRFRVSRVWTTTCDAEFNQITRVDPSGGAVTVTLPSAEGLTGHMCIIKNTTSSATAITVTARGTQTIDGSATDSMTGAYLSTRYVSDGTNWMRI